MKCRQAQPRISDYIDSALSARDTWELERHIAACPQCARMLAEMRSTVRALQAAHRHQVPSGFGAALEARLAGLEPSPRPRPWMGVLAEAVRPRALSWWGAGAATLGLAALVALSRPVYPPASATAPDVQAARLQNVALSASDPLDDLAAANLAASTTQEIPQESDANR